MYELGMKSKLKKELVIQPKWPNQDLPCDFEPLSHPLGTGPANKQSAYHTMPWL